MGNKLIYLGVILIFSIHFLFSFSGKPKNRFDLEKEKTEWKKVAITISLYKCLNYNDSLRRKDGSLAGYFQKSELFGLDDLEKTNVFINKYIASKKYKSKSGSTLIIMKCLDLYDDNELDKFIDTLIQKKIKN